MNNNSHIQNINYSIIHLKNSLFKYQLSVFYRKINLDKFDFNHINKNYHNMMRIMGGLSAVIKFHSTIKNIVLVLNNNNYELYMLANKSYSKMLEDKGMTIVRFLNYTNESSYSKKRKLDSIYDIDEPMKKYKPNPKNISLDIIKKELKSKRIPRKIHSNSIDNKLIEKFKDLSEKDKNDLLSLLDKTPKVTNVINKKDDDLDIIIDRNGNNSPDKKSAEIEKQTIINEPSISGIIIYDNKKSEKDMTVTSFPIREKRNIKKVSRYHDQFF